MMTSISIQSATAAPAVLKEDASARVEFVPSRQGARLRKTYHPRGLRVLQSFLLRSRARREFDNLVRLNAAGVPCVRSMAWAERRVLGLVRTSSVETGWVEGTRDLRAVLRGRLDEADRRGLAAAYGGLLRRLHASGHCSTTLSPRNVLVRGRAELLVCDQPHLVSVRGLRIEGRMAEIDLFDAFFSELRLREWSSRDRWVGLLAYYGQDRERAAASWRRLGRRSKRAHRFQKGIARILQRLPGPIRTWAVRRETTR